MPAFTLRKKFKLKENAKLPGPGAYSSKDLKRRAPMFLFGTASQREFGKANPKNKSPGPGDY